MWEVTDEAITLTVSRETARKVVWGLAFAAAVPVVGAAVWWVAEKSYNHYAPHMYQYRPGTITGYMSRVLSQHAQHRRKRAPVRVYMDGCFDMMHYGHANALRQARSLGDELVVGLIPDSEILMAKGPPVQSTEERKIMVEAVKWVDEVITGVPYLLTPEFLKELFSKHRIDYVVHGDDPCLLPDGSDAYEFAKKQGRFKMIKRTEGVSSTDIVGRMLMCTRDNARFRPADKGELRRLNKQFSIGHRDVDLPEAEREQPPDAGKAELSKHDSKEDGNRTTLSRFMPTSQRIVQFSNGKSAGPGAKIVYIDGAFDMFHVGHIQILAEARQAGDFLLVGLHTDEDVSARRGPHLPIMDLHERSLSVLACKHVNEVVIGAPLEITEDLMKTFNIGLVVRGTVSEGNADSLPDPRRYRVPKAKGKYRDLPSPSTMTTSTIMERIVRNRQLFEERNARKVKSEAAYYQQHKAFVDEA